MGDVRYDGTVEKILKAEKDGLCRFTLATNQGAEARSKFGTVTCIYIASRIREGLPVSVTGTWNGNTFAVRTLKKRYNRRDVYNYLVSHCRKIGKVAAENAIDALTDRIFSVSAEEIRNRLTEVGFDKHLTSAQMEELGERLKADDGKLCELQDFIALHRGQIQVCTRICAVIEEDPIGYVKRNPYGCCMSFGLVFSAADSIAKACGIPRETPERLEALAWTALDQAKENGDSYLPAKELLADVNRLSDTDDDSRQYTLLKLLTMLNGSKRFSVEKDRVYMSDLYEAEKDVAGMLTVLSSAKAEYVTASDKDIKAVEKKYKITYAPEQKEAFKAAGIPGVSMIIGGPGTGKTTTMKGIADTFVKNNPGKTIALCAPSGRAAKRLAEATGRPASTIHRLLHYVPFTNIDELRNMHTHDNPLDASLIILDETSMVSLPLFRLFLDAVKPGTSVILVGDRNQLPSVEVGNVLSDLMGSGCFPVYELEANYRQAGAVGLRQSCGKILSGEIPGAGDGVEIVKMKTPEESLEFIEAWFFSNYDKREPFNVQILSPSYKGAAGINAVNPVLQEEPVKGYRVGKGDRVIFTRTSNDPDGDEGYINGDMGIITDISRGRVKIKRDWDGVSVSYSDSVLEDIQLAYDLTIHRSQGSEFKDVLVYLPEKPRGMLKRNLLYTAVTRAKKTVTILYEGTALEDAVADASSLDRYSGLTERIRVKFNK